MFEFKRRVHELSVAIFISQFLLQIIPYKLMLHFITHKYTRQTDTFIRYSAEQKATKNGICIQKKTSAQKKKKKIQRYLNKNWKHLKAKHMLHFKKRE